MALKFYWRFENSGTLDGTHDYSAGDTTATNNGSPTFDGSTYKIGSYAGSYPSASAQHRFDPASIISSGGPGGSSAGAVAFWFYTTSGRSTDRDLFFYVRGSASSNDNITLRCGGSNTIKFIIRNATNGGIELAHGSTISDNTWYFVVFAWDSAASTRRISLYDSSGAEIGTTVTDNSTGFTTNLPANLTSRLQFGDNTGSGPYGFVDNVFIGDAYADADTFVSKKSITSYTEYAGDVTAPVLTAPVATATSATTATIGATTDEANGTLYAVITTSSTQPSVAQIKAGQNHLGASATWSSSQAVSSTGAKTFSVTGLTAGTMYYTYKVQADAANNDSNVVASGFAAYDVSAASVTPVTQNVALNATGSFVYTLDVVPATVTPTVNNVALTLSTSVPTTAVVPATRNIVLSVTLPVTAAQATPLTQNVALNFSGVVAYTLNVTPALPTITMQDVALNPGYPSAGGAGATTGRRNRRYSYALKYFSRG